MFGRMVLTVGLENTQKKFKLLGMPYDVEDRKVSILSSIVDQSYSIIKKQVWLSGIILSSWYPKVFLTICFSIA
jgi:hypothetical protein